MSAAETDYSRLIANLSYGARAGAYCLITLGLFFLFLFALVPLGIVKMSDSTDPDLWMGAWLPVTLFFGFCFWL